MVVVPTPTSLAARPLSSRLAACAISLWASGSDIDGREVYPRLEDTPPPLRLHYQSLKDSLRFQVEEDLELGDPSQGVHGLPFHDVGSGLLVEVPRRNDCEGGVGEGRGEGGVGLRFHSRVGGSREWPCTPSTTVRSACRPI